MLCGGRIKYKDYELETDGIIKSICNLIEAYDKCKNDTSNEQRIKELEEQLKKCQEQLDLTIPDTSTNSN